MAKNYRQRKTGRQKNVPNMKKLDNGNLMNKEGVVFTEAEKKALVSAVNSAQLKRRNMLKWEGSLPRIVDGKETGDTVASRQRMGSESDFILQPKSKSLHQFKTKEQYNRYMENLSRINTRDYINERVDLYKQNHIEAIKRELGEDESKDIIEKIQKMSRKDYMKRVAQNDEDLEIHYIYSNDEKEVKRNKIRTALGLDDLEEEWVEEEYF